MKIITLLNEKGGVGKTTLTATLGALFAQMGQRVLLLDGDSQGHLTLAAQVPEQNGLFNLVANNASFAEVLVEINPAWYGCPADEPTRLSVLPGANQTADLIKPDGSGNPPLAFRLIPRLRELDGYVDLILIDTNPSISELHMAYHLASDWVILPTLCARYSINSLKKSLDHLAAAKAFAATQGVRVAELLGIVPNMFNPSEKIQYQLHGWLQGKYGDENVFPPVHHRTVWKQAESKRLPVFVYSPRSEATREIRQVGESIMERMCRGER